MEFFNGRALTESEAALRSKSLCIACGQPAYRTKRKDKADMIEFECAACRDARTNYGTGANDTPQNDFGARRASLRSEFRSRLGYHAAAGDGPEFETRDPGVESTTREKIRLPSDRARKKKS